MNFIKTLDPNLTGRDFVVGDLHGCFNALVNLLFNLRFDPDADRLISVGDLVDRGPKSYECLELLYEPWFHAVRGNHEQMMLNSFANNEQAIDWAENWIRNGGMWASQALVAYDTEAKDRLDPLLEKARELPYLITISRPDGKKFHVLHAELPPNRTDVTDEMLADEEQVQKLALFTESSQHEEAFLWTRNIFRPFAYQDLSNVKKMFRTVDYMFRGDKNPFSDKLSHIISGHSILHRPITLFGQTNIDTGAFSIPNNRWAALTCVELGDWKFYQATETEFRETNPVVINTEDFKDENETD